MLDSFITTYAVPQRVGTNEANFGQCVGLVMKYFTDLGLPWFPGNAKDLLQTAPQAFYDVIINNTSNTTQLPAKGDVVVFSSVWGNGYGHTGICVAASPTSFTLFEQNNPIAATPHMVNHPQSHYATVLGWIRPRAILKDMTIQNRDEGKALYFLVYGRIATDAEADGLIGKTIEEIRSAWPGSEEWLHDNDLRVFGDQRISQIEDLQKQLTAAKAQVNTLSGQLTPSALSSAAATLAQHNKFWIALVGFGVMLLNQYLGSSNPMVQDIIGFFTATGVLVVPNKPKS